MSKKLPDHINGLIRYLSSPDEKANEDLLLKYFRKTFGDEFTRQEEADRSDGYLPGHFVLELKGKTNDWLSGLFQGMAYRKNLDFGVVIVAAKNFLAIWSIEDLGEDLLSEVMAEKGAPSAIGKRLSQKYKEKKAQLLKKAAYQFPTEYLGGLFQGSSNIFIKEVESFEKTIKSRKKVRHKITTKNFTTVLKQMSEYFDPDKPIKIVRAFYSMIFGWHNTSILEISAKFADQATLAGEVIECLVPGKREKFKKFVESHYIHLDESENEDDFFAMYDVALDSVDKNFRIRNGIFFTDLDLSRFAMWFVRNQLGDIGKNYLVIDPACGSGNLVTNWRSPMELRHKVVSEIEPELLYTVEQRMKGDKWHHGKFTVVPKVTENIGLNFLDKSAEDYIAILKKYLSEKGQKTDRPIAFLCNPPYRNDDDQSADSVNYSIHPTILDVVGKDASSERVSCFLAQMKRIAEEAEDSGLPGETLLLLFTGTAWLSQRPVYEKIRSEIFGNFEDISGFMVTSNEFFDVNGKFPISFTIWKYTGKTKALDETRSIELLDLTWLKKENLREISWNEPAKLSESCENIIKSSSTKRAKLGSRFLKMKEWSQATRFEFQREKRKAEKVSKNFHCGLPKGDPRHERKKTLGEKDGQSIGFVDDLTPCRIAKNLCPGAPWFRLNSPFMDVRKNRCFSGPVDQKGFSSTDFESIKKMIIWYSLGRVFSSHGYPIWVNADEMWPLIPPPHLMEKLVRLSFAITYAENECVSTVFPAGNPVPEAKEITISNPMTALDPNSFWNTKMVGVFKGIKNETEIQLVNSVNKIYAIWNKRCARNGEVYVDYKKAYFIGNRILFRDSGIVQIRDYAKENNDEELLFAFEEMSLNLKNVKDEYNKLLHQKTGFNYFEINEKRLKNLVPNVETSETTNGSGLKGFQNIIEFRTALACKIVDELSDSREFSRVKFAKAFYLADMVSGIDLKTEYTRDAAGPLDQRALYNEKFGIEANAARLGYFETEKKKGKDFHFVEYTAGSKISEGVTRFKKLFGKSSDRIEKIIKLTEPMTRDQIEIVATLYACWNDFLIAKKPPTNEALIKDFKEKWHPEKTKKFTAAKGKKPRFTEKQLVDAIAWMKAKGIIPTGEGKRTKIKISKNDRIPF